jgi:hypothetical protein
VNLQYGTFGHIRGGACAEAAVSITRSANAGVNCAFVELRRTFACLERLRPAI